MSDLSLVMAGVLTTGQPVVEIPLQPVQPQKQVKATSTELPSVSYPDIAPPEFSRQQENPHLNNQEIPASISTAEKLYIESLIHQGITNPEFSSGFTNPYSERHLECPSNFRYSSVNNDHNSLPQSLVSHFDKADKLTIDSQTLPVLHFGDVGDAVRVLQRLLLCNRYAIKVDGNFGVVTEAAVKAFQNQRHINVDGVVGEETWHELTG